MSRDEGFAVADVATAKHTDPKFKALWRLLRDESLMNAASVLYEAIQLTSWQHGERVNAEDAAPVWMTDVDGPTKALVQVGLLDADKRIPAHAWTAWFGPATERRKNLRDKWARANRNRRGKGDSGGGTAKEPPSSPRGDNGGTAAPVRPSSPSVPSINQSSPTPAGAEKHGSKNETDEERLARYLLLRDDASKSADIRWAAKNEVERLEALRLN